MKQNNSVLSFEELQKKLQVCLDHGFETYSITQRRKALKKQVSTIEKRIKEIDKAKEKIEELSKALDLESVMNRKAGKLSGGWQRRLSIAMALVSEPKVLFLDEPTLGLDVIARSELWDLIESLKGKTTIVLTTHYMEEAEALSDRLGVMKNGRLLFTGTVKEMKEKTGAERIEDAFIKMIKEAK